MWALRESCLRVKMVSEPKYADRDQIDRYDVVEQSRHEQNENSSDQGNKRIDHLWVKVRHHFPPVS